MKVITLTTKRDLNIYMNPQRQQLMRLMQLSGTPVTPKQLSVKMGVSASSVQHHIGKLLELGLLELDHTQSIHGITAKFYHLTNTTVSIGSYLQDEHRQDRYALMQSLIASVFSGFVNRHIENLSANTPIEKSGDFLSGAIHLTDEDAKELYGMIRSYIEAHEHKGKDTIPWEYELIAYPAGDKVDE